MINKKQRKLDECVGEFVTWASSYTEKGGTILSVNRSGQRIEDDRVFSALGIEWCETKISQSYSENHRFLIRVDRFGAKGGQLKPHYYCANVSTVARSMGWELTDV